MNQQRTVVMTARSGASREFQFHEYTDFTSRVKRGDPL
jgi:hypothetical protein